VGVVDDVVLVHVYGTGNREVGAGFSHSWAGNWRIWNTIFGTARKTSKYHLVNRTFYKQVILFARRFTSRKHEPLLVVVCMYLV